MATQLYDVHGFLTLTNGSATFSGTEGWQEISFRAKNDNAGNITISSNYTGQIGGQANGNIILEASETTTIGSGEDAVDGVTVTAPAGNTVYVQAVKHQNQIGV